MLSFRRAGAMNLVTSPALKWTRGALRSPRRANKLAPPKDKRLVVYTGRMFTGYDEVEYLLEPARASPRTS
jgi:hypothetical protein